MLGTAKTVWKAIYEVKQCQFGFRNYGANWYCPHGITYNRSLNRVGMAYTLYLPNTKRNRTRES